MRSARRVQRIGITALAFLLAFALAFLARDAAVAADVERQIPVIRDTDGSGLTIEITREGTRQTAIPFLTLNTPTIQRIEDRIAKKVAGLAAKRVPSNVTAGGSHSRIDLIGTTRGESGPPEPNLSAPPPVPGEITVRGVQRTLKELRASRKENPVPAVVVAVPEQRIERTDTPPHGVN